MVRHAFLAASLLFIGLIVFVMTECPFLIPYRRLLWARYAGPLAIWGAIVFLNLFALSYAVGRRLFLKDTGRKLAHLEKQLRSGSLSDELRRRLQE